MNLRSPIQGMFAYPTLVLFCEGKGGIAAAKALIEATPDSGGLNFPLRQDVRMYYRVSYASMHSLTPSHPLTPSLTHTLTHSHAHPPICLLTYFDTFRSVQS